MLFASVNPFFSRSWGYATSADRNKSKGAPFEIWAANVPDDPSDRRTLLPVSRSKSVMISLTANPRSDAAATTTSAAFEGRDAEHIKQMTKRIFFITFSPHYRKILVDYSELPVLYDIPS